jgi:hypothetical protein
MLSLLHRQTIRYFPFPDTESGFLSQTLLHCLSAPPTNPSRNRPASANLALDPETFFALPAASLGTLHALQKLTLCIITDYEQAT